MHRAATIESFYTSSAPLQGAGRIHARQGNTPVPFCQTLVKLADLEKAMQDKHSLLSLSSLLSADENELFSSFTYPKRRREWLGGRLAAKTAVLKLLQVENFPDVMPALSILPAENGSPRLHSSIPDADELLSLSISHSDRFAVAMAAKAEACGIDIQKITEQTVRVAERFSEPDELQLLKRHAPLLNTKERLTLLWSAKEAFKKALLFDQPVIFQGVVLQSLHTDNSFTLHLHFPGDRNHPAEITAVMLEDCMLAFTSVQKSHA